MDQHVILLERLALAERRVAEGTRQINHQYRLIAELERDGHDTTDAINRVIEFLETQELRLHDRDLLRVELEEFQDLVDVRLGEGPNRPGCLALAAERWANWGAEVGSAAWKPLQGLAVWRTGWNSNSRSG